jgi:RNA polymerase sigma-54 factor
LRLKLVNKLTYKLKLTPRLKLAINLLQMPLIELRASVAKQVEENPLLEFESKELLPNLPGSNYNFDDEKQQYKESLINKPPTLCEHLLKQLRLTADMDAEYKTGELIIENIDEDGYFRCSIEEIGESLKIDLSRVERVLLLIQTFDPLGVGARDLRECLLSQMKGRVSKNSLEWQITDNFLSFLEKKRYKHIAQKFNVSIEDIKQAVKKIAQLEPKPGRSFNAEEIVCLTPDAVLRKNKDGFEVVFNNWDLPRLTFNNKYKKMLRQKDTPRDVKKYLRERFEAAKSLIDAIEKRKKTLHEVMEAIVFIQKDYLEKGKEHFRPMTLFQIADMVGKHKSTISRAVNNKYLQTPYGIFELKKFFNSSVKQENGKCLSSKTIKFKIESLINNENKENPLTDQRIVERFKQEGMVISRRAIAKYRSQLKILSSRSRQE